MGQRGTKTRLRGTATKEMVTKGSASKHDHQDAGVQDLLDRFARAVTAGDGDEIASLWAVPAFVIGDDMVRAVNSLEEVKEFFSGAKEQYNARGITDTRPDVFGLEWVTDRIAVVDVRWPYLDERGKEVGEEASTYTLRRDDAGDLKLHVALMRGASA